MFNTLKLSKERQKYLVPLIDKAKYDDILSALQDFGINQEDANRFLEILQTSNIKKILEFIEQDESAKSKLSYLEEIIKLLKKSFNIKEYKFKIGIVRGLDYYKGLVFEIDAPVLGAEKQLCGGGAYDLVKLFGGRDTPTAGFAIGFDRTLLALEIEKFSFVHFLVNKRSKINDS